MMQKFNTHFYIEMLRMVFGIVENASAQLQNAQLNFCKAHDDIACTKASITSARNEARSQTVSANDVGEDPELSGPRKASQRLDEYLNAFFRAEPNDNCGQLYYEMLDFVISRLNDRFEPEATAAHFTK